MRVMAFLACLLVSLDCFSRAVGLMDQQIFAPDLIMLWNIPALVWAGYGVLILWRGTE
jgi:hypothetical protein